jgi:hypothetical protein
MAKSTPSMQLTPEASPSPYSITIRAPGVTTTQVTISDATNAPKHAAAAILHNIAAPIAEITATSSTTIAAK